MVLLPTGKLRRAWHSSSYVDTLPLSLSGRAYPDNSYWMTVAPFIIMRHHPELEAHHTCSLQFWVPLRHGGPRITMARVADFTRGRCGS